MAWGEWFHNNVQCNLALRHDECFHAVPGSNARHFTEEEAAHFDAAVAQGQNQVDPDAILAGGMSVTLEPGQMILQNNVLIHRGWGGLRQGPDGGVVRSVSAAQHSLCLSATLPLCHSAVLSQDRRTLHFGFHSAHRPPTWHFRRGLTDTFDAMSAAEQGRVAVAMRSHIKRRKVRCG